jgi:chromosomal replication initiator protein
MVQSLKAKRLEAFKEKFRRQCDVLVLDGVQFLSGKSKTQMELAHTLDALFHTHKRVVLTSNALPREIPDMEEGLRSRLTGGLVVDIKPPDPGTRCRILQQKAEHEGIQFPAGVAEYVSQRVVGNVRQLESVLIHLLAKASLLHKAIDLDLAKEALRDLYHDLALPKKPAIQEILNCVCKHFHMEKDLLLSRSRKKAVYQPRQVAMYLCREHTDSTLTAIGKAFRRDHASVIHSLAVIHRKSVTDATIRKQLSFLAEQILKDR